RSPVDKGGGRRARARRRAWSGRGATARKFFSPPTMEPCNPAHGARPHRPPQCPAERPSGTADEALGKSAPELHHRTGDRKVPGTHRGDRRHGFCHERSGLRELVVTNFRRHRLLEVSCPNPRPPCSASPAQSTTTPPPRCPRRSSHERRGRGED